MLINKNTIIYGEKVVLVPYEANHVPKYHSWMQCEELLQLTGSERLQLEEEYANQISWRVDEKKCTFIILDKNLYVTSGHNEIASMVGDVNLFLNRDDEYSAEIEIMIAETDARGKGFGKEAVLLMIRFGIESLQLKEFTAKIGISNTSSLGLFCKLGFEEVSKSDVFQEITLKLPVTELLQTLLQKQTYEVIKTV